MPGSKWDFDFDTTTDSDTRDDLRPKSSEARADQFGTRIALLALCIGLFIAAIWFVKTYGPHVCGRGKRVGELTWRLRPI